MSEPAQSRGSVLVIDDDEAMRTSLEALLVDDFEVRSAANPLAAEKLLKLNPVDVVLTDFEMPGENGLKFLQRIASTHPDTLGILLTGHAEHPEVKAAEALQTAIRVILKPYRPDRLIKWVDNAVRLARMRKAVNRLRAPQK